MGLPPRRRPNVVITREGSLSPRSRSGSASPTRGGHEAQDRTLPQQMNYQDVVILFRKWHEAKAKAGALEAEVVRLRGCLREDEDEATLSRDHAAAAANTKARCRQLQETLKNAKTLLNASRQESAKLSRRLVAKNRKLAEAQQEAASVPSLTKAMERLLEDKGRAEDALGVEGRRADAEERRSKAWTDQMNELSMQAVRSTENCRVLCTDNAELRQELDRVKGLLDNAKKGGLKATARIDELRLKEIEAGLLTDELEAVRGDCGRLVQLVSSTNEYRQFRRLWDDSGGLTRIDNSKGTFSTGKCYNYQHRLSDATTAATTTDSRGNSTPHLVPYDVQRRDNASTKPPPPPPPPPQHRRHHQQGGEDGAPRTSVAWEEVLRSEWSSPLDKIISAAAAATAGTVNRGVSGVIASKVELPGPEIPEAKAQARNQRESRGRKAATPEGLSRVNRQIGGGNCAVGDSGGGRNFGGNRQNYVSFKTGGHLSARQCVMSDTPTGDEITVPTAISKDAWKDGLRILGSATEVGRMEGEGVAGGMGVVEGGQAKQDEGVVRWGHVDLLSVLYPTPPTDNVERPGASDPGVEASMWVPREAAGLCRRFVSEFNGYSGLPLDEEQRRLLFGLLFNLNMAWRQSERRRVGRLKTRYRTELAAVNRRLEMRKSLKTVAAERAAERTRTPISVATAGSDRGIGYGSGIRQSSATWGKDGRKIRMRCGGGGGDAFPESGGRGEGACGRGACAELPIQETAKTPGNKIKRGGAKARGGKRSAIGGTKRKGGRAGGERKMEGC